MVSEDFKEYLATLASVCTVLQFLAGVLVCRKFVKNGTTGDASGLAFITCFMSCSLWLKYGVLIGDSFVMLVNLFGVILQLGYIITFVVYTVKRSIIWKQFFIALCFLGTVYLYSIYEEDRATVIRSIGLLSCTVTIAFFASPLIVLAHVIRVKSADSLPFPVICATFVTSCQWFAYGSLLGDPFITIPNFLGCVLSAFQLSLFLYYPTKKVNPAHFI